MAIPNNYIDKITDKDKNESRLICPAAENVRVENENFEADNLDDVLEEMQHAIDEAASQGGIQQETDPTVPSWAKQPNPPTPQQIGAVPSQGYVPLTQAEKDKLDALPTSSELGTQLGTKADKSTTYTKTETDNAIADAVEGLGGGSVESVSVNGGQPVQPNQNGNVNLQGVATKDYVDDAVDDKLTEVTVNAVGNSASMYFAGSALCISTANLIQVTVTPTITYVDNEQNVVVSIRGSGTLKAYLDGVEQTLVNGSFTIAKTSVVQNVVVTATAKEDNKAISAEAELPIEVGAYVDRSKMLTGFGTNSTDFPIYLNGSSEPSFTAVVDTEHPFTKYGTTMYNWSVNFSEEETQPTELYNATNRNIFVNAIAASNTSVYGITHIPDSVTTLSNTFQNCSNLKEINIGNVTDLTMAFKSSGLAGDIDFSESVLQHADNQAFMNCGYITSMKFPTTLLRLGGTAMYGCTNLASLTFTGNTPPTVTASNASNNALNGCTALAHIYVPIGTRAAYVTAFTSALGYLEKSTDIIEEISE